jgi:DnaJ-class molecular chaperone
MKRPTNFVEAISLASKFFSLSLPTTEDELKKAFRSASKVLHPDVGGDEELFKSMKEAYEKILDVAENFGCVFSDGDDFKLETTIEGIPLVSLGLGLGLMVNGKDCYSCNHQGYTKHFGVSYKVCGCEDGMIRAVFPCSSCKGTGKFEQRSGRIIDCRRCGGTGKFIHPYKMVICPKCRGSATIQSFNDEWYYRRCGTCNGTGEIKIFNPVLPKGRLMGLK